MKTKELSTRKTIALLTLNILFCGFINGQIIWDGKTIADGFAQGNGTKNNPFLIKTPAEFVYFLKSIDNGNTYNGQYIKLVNEISMNYHQINTNSSISIDGVTYNGRGSFDGVFDGDNHFINSLTRYDYLFRELNGTICNLGFENDNQNGYGALVSHVNKTGLIVSCYHILKKESSSYYFATRVGFASSNSGEIINCKITGKVQASQDYGYARECAGIATYNSGKILHCDLSDYSMNGIKKIVSENRGVVDYGELGYGQAVTNNDNAYNEWKNTHSNINYNLPSQNPNKKVYISDSYGLIEEKALNIPNGSLLSNYVPNPTVADCIFAGWEIRDKVYAPNSIITIDDNLNIKATWSQVIVSQPTSGNVSVSVSDSEHAKYQWFTVKGEITSFSDWTSPYTSNDETNSYTYYISSKQGQILSFDWGTSSESSDMLIVTVDGEIILKKGGVDCKGHIDHSFTTSGNHEVIVSYSRDDSEAEGQNKVWVRNLCVSNKATPLNGQTEQSMLLQDTPTDGYVWCEITYSNSSTKLITDIINTSRSHNYIYTKPLLLKAGEVFNLPVYLNNEVEIANLQFDFEVPDGFSVECIEDEYNILKGERATDDHTIICDLISKSKYRILCTSTSNSSLNNTDKSLPIMYIPIVIDDNMKLGQYLLYFTDITVDSYDATNILVQSYSTKKWIIKTNVTNFWSINVESSNKDHGSFHITGEQIRRTDNGIEVPSDSQITLDASPSSHYRFSHWEENGSTISTKNPYVLTVSNNHNIKAVFVYDAYTMDFLVDEELYYSSKQRHNDKLKVPEQDPYKEGYTFTGWKGVDSNTKVPGHNAKYTAQFTINTYNVKFVAKEQTVSDKKMNYGTTIVPPNAPIIDDYVFMSWGTVDSNVPAHDVIYTAEYVLLGDLYEDSKLNVADLTNIVGLILSLPEDITERAKKIADLYKDGIINVSDYTSLVGKILNYPIVQHVINRSSVESTKMDVSVHKNSEDSEADVIIKFNNPNDISAIQFDIILPSGLSFDSEKMFSLNGYMNHSVSYNYLGVDKIRIVICSPMNDAILSQDELSLHFVIQNKLAGESSICIENIIGASYDSQIILEDMIIPIQLKNMTSLELKQYNDDLIVSYVNGCIILESSIEQNVVIQSLNGGLLETIHIDKDATITRRLPRGMYLINGSTYYLF